MQTTPIKGAAVAPTTRPALLSSGTSWCLFACAVGAAIFIGMVVRFARLPLTYDEPWYLSNVPEFQRLGLSREFLRGLTGAAGPLYTIVQSLVAPWTGAVTPGVRAVNVVLLVAAAGALYVLLRLLDKPENSRAGPIVGAASLLGVPFLWPSAGMALTEIPAVLFVVLWLLLMWLAVGFPSTSPPLRGVLAVAAGLSFGLAVTGRQMVLLMLAGLVALGFRPNAERRPQTHQSGVIGFAFAPLSRSTAIALAIMSAIAAAVVIIPVFWVWGGLTPPGEADLHQGIALGQLPLAAAYIGIAFVILAPRWFRGSMWTVAVLSLVCAIGNLLLGIGELKPMAGWVNRFVPSLASTYGRLVYGVFAAFGVSFLVSTIRNAWDRRREGFFVLLAIALLASLATTMKVTYQFSSRYVVTSLPVVIVLAQGYGPLTRGKSLRLLMGIILGAVSLYGYYWYWTREDTSKHVPSRVQALLIAEAVGKHKALVEASSVH